MAAFEYQALVDGKQNTRGVIQADTARSARAQLRERGLIPLEIHEVESQSKREFSFRSQGRERALILRQLATLLRAGLTLEEVLSVLVEQTDSSQQRRQLGLDPLTRDGGPEPVGRDGRSPGAVSGALQRLGGRR